MNRPVQTASPEELYNVIVGATSQDPAVMSASAERLKAMLEMLGTYDGLSAIAAQKAFPIGVRQQSIIQLKNAVVPRWKQRRCVILTGPDCVHVHSY